MPRKKDRRVSQGNAKAVMLSSSPIRAEAARSELATSILKQQIIAAAAHPPLPRSNNLAEATPAHRLFWAWYGAGVDTVRYALFVQSVLHRQMTQVSPVSLALQYSVAFQVAFQAFTTDHDRALA